MYVRVSAQPLHGDGTVGFDDRNPLHESATSLPEALYLMGNTMLDHDQFDQWDLTVEIDR
jgi:hypothetical protein